MPKIEKVKEIKINSNIEAPITTIKEKEIVTSSESIINLLKTNLEINKIFLEHMNKSKEIELKDKTHMYNELTKIYLNHIKETKRDEMDSYLKVITGLVENVTETNNNTNRMLLKSVKKINDYNMLFNVIIYSVYLFFNLLFFLY